ncbi:MAG: hypothetical protein QNJ17_04125 [Desulfocapsaceae bacterium]|nr:hypothetical protein [Desulfocapsaceae bacterium]
MVKENSGKNKYTCNEYREEMILAALQRRLQQNNLSEEEKTRVLQEIAELEKKMGL